MSDPKQALETQLKNLQARCGKSLEEIGALVRASGLSKHGEIVALLKRDLGLGHGDANTVVHHLRSAASDTGAASAAAVAAGGDVEAIYPGPKAALVPIHEAIMSATSALGPFEIAPKKAYLSLRRQKQFATVGPATRTQVELGLNMKGVAPTARLVQLPPGGMCQYRVRIEAPAEVDAELIGWIRTAYDASG